MGPVYTPAMRSYDELISAMISERNTFAAGNVLDRARGVIENWKKQHDEIRALLDPRGIDRDKPISVLVADKFSLSTSREEKGK